MEHKKDIGKAIREKLEPFEASPRPDLWQAIEADLPKKRKRRIPPFWFLFAGIAVVAVLLYVAGRSFGENTTPGTQASVEDEKSGADAVKDSNFRNNPSSTSQSSSVSGAGQNESFNDEDQNSVNAITNTASGNQNPNPQEINLQHSTGIGPNGKKASKPATLDQPKNIATASAEKKLKTGKLSSGNSNKSGGVASKNSSAMAKTDGQSFESPIRDSIDIKAGSNINASESQANQTVQTDSIPKAIAENKKEDKKEKAKDTTKTIEIEAVNQKTFSIFLYAAPTYYNNFSKKSTIDSRLDSIQGKAEITFNYGGYLLFDYDEKWSVRAGLAKTTLRRRTNDIDVSSLNSQNFYNVDYRNGVSNQSVAIQFADSGYFSVVQEISYLEIPVELKYKLVNKTITIEGIGGISTLLLKDNVVTAESDNNGSVILGSTKDMYKSYFSANLGIGFSYELVDNLRVNVEPVFKYHFRTASVAFQPYSIVVLGGLEYTFNWTTKKKADKN